MAVRIAEAAVVFSAITGPMAKGAATVKKTVTDLGKEVDKIGVGRGRDRVAEQLRGHERQYARAGLAAKKYSDDSRSSLASIGMYAAGGILSGGTLAIGSAAMSGIGSMGGILTESVQVASAFEQTSIAFETMLGDAGKAKVLLGEIKDFAAKSPLTFESAAVGVKQLLAYGIAADQALPTLRALTDIASGTGAELGRLTMAYGQVATAGQLYGTEMRQFTEAGVDLPKAIGVAMGVSTDRVKALVEEGKVGFPQVQKALKILTEDGGRFAGMTEKYGQSFGGVTEQLTDALQTLKREAGFALIEELGLKDAARDLADFAGRSRSVVDEFRPAIRLVGDGTKAMAQLANEGAKAARIFAEVRLENLLGDVPALRALVPTVSAVLKDIQDFRIDRVKVTEAAIAVVDAMEPLFEHVQKKFGALTEDAEKFRKSLLGVADAAKTITNAIPSSLGTGAGVVKFLTPTLPDAPRFGADPLKALRPMSRAERAALAVAEAADDREMRLSRFANLSGAMGGGATTPLRELGMYPGVTDAIGRGKGPASADPTNILTGWPAIKEMLRASAKVSQALESSELAKRSFGRHTDPLSTEFKASGAIAGGALAALGASATQATAKLLALGDVVGVSAQAREAGNRLAKSTRAVLDPIGTLAGEVAAIREAEAAKLISTDAAAIGVREALQSASRGVDLGYKPPSSAEYGTSDFARMEAAAFAPRRGESVEDILQVMKEYARQELEQSKLIKKSLDENLAEMGVKVVLPGQ